MSSRDIMNYVVTCGGICSLLLLYWSVCTPPITTRNKIIPSFLYRVKVSRYSATCISDHLYRKTIYKLQLIYTLIES